MQVSELQNSFLKKSVWLYVFSLIIAPIGYIIKIIVAGSITPEELGTIYGVISIIVILSAYNDFGVTESLKYFIPRYKEEKKYDKIKSILVLSFIVQAITGIIIGGILFFLSDYMALHYFESQTASSVIKIFSAFFLGINFFQIVGSFLLAMDDTFNSKLIEFIRMIFSLIFVGVVSFLSFGSVELFSYSWLIGLYIGVLFAVGIFYFRYYRVYLFGEKIYLDREFLKTTFKYSMGVVLVAQAGVILSQIDMLQIIYFLGSEDAGYYSVYLTFISIPFLVVTPISSYLLSVISRLHSSSRDRDISELRRTLFKYFLFVGLIFSSFFFVFANYISYILFGEDYIISGDILRYSILFLVFNFFIHINFSTFSGIGKLFYRAKVIIYGIIINFILNIIFINYLGVYGAALGTALSWVVIYLLSEKNIDGIYKFDREYLYILKNIGLSIILGGIFYFIFDYYLGYEYFSRGESVFVLVGIFVLYLGVFFLVNLSYLRGFMSVLKNFKSIK